MLFCRYNIWLRLHLHLQLSVYGTAKIVFLKNWVSTIRTDVYTHKQKNRRLDLKTRFTFG